ncbi:MAG: hypothetical protein AB7F88_09840 [Pyrinomonadaceae bacterium]
MKYQEFLNHLRKPASRESIEDEYRFELSKLRERSFSGLYSIDEINAEIQKLTEWHNSYPQADFEGLSSIEMGHLLYDPFEKYSPVKIKQEIPHDVLNKIGFFRLAEEFLRMLAREGSLKLTKAGAITRNVLAELYEHRFVADWVLDAGISRLRREDDSPVMRSLHVIVKISGLVRKTHGKLFLTKKGLGLIDTAKRTELFGLIFHTFTREFNWAYNDGYPDFPLCGQACGFSIYLLSRFGNEDKAFDFYSRRFLKAFPMSIDNFESTPYSSAEKMFSHCYQIRTFSRFLEWFSLVKPIERPARPSAPKPAVRKSELFDQVFEVRKK